MRVMNGVERAAVDCDPFQRSMTFLLVMTSEAKHLRSEVLRVAQNDSFEQA